MRTQSGLHPVTSTYSLEKWATKASLKKLVGKFFSMSPLVNRGSVMDEGWLVDERGASKIKVKNVNKKRMATVRRLIFFGISQGIHC